jgi:hypothetical protein
MMADVRFNSPKIIGSLFAYMAFIFAFVAVKSFINREWWLAAFGTVMMALMCWGAWRVFAGRWQPPQRRD